MSSTELKKQTPEFEQEREYEKFETLVLEGNPMALRNEDQSFRRRAQLSSYFEDFFKNRLGLSEEDARAVVEGLDDLFDKRARIKKDKNQGELSLGDSLEAHKQIDKAFIQRLQKVIAECRKQKEEKDNEAEKSSPEQTDEIPLEEQAHDTKTEGAAEEIEGSTAKVGYQEYVDHKSNSEPKDVLKDESKDNVENIEATFNTDIRDIGSFHELWRSQEGVAKLQQLVRSRTEAVDTLLAQKELDHESIQTRAREDGALQDIRWKLYESTHDYLLEFFDNYADKNVELSEEVLAIAYNQFNAFLTLSSELIDALNRYEAGEKTNGDDEDIIAKRESRDTEVGESSAQTLSEDMVEEKDIETVPYEQSAKPIETKEPRSVEHEKGHYTTEELQRLKDEVQFSRERYSEALEAYYRRERSRGVLSKGLNATLSLFGFPKDVSADVAELDRRHVAARKMYLNALSDQMLYRAANAKKEGVGTKFNFDSSGIKHDAARKYVIKPAQENRQIRNSVYVPSDSETGVFAHLRRASGKAAEYKWTRRIAMLAIGGFSGGTVAAGSIARKALGMTVGASAGAFVGKKVWSWYDDRLLEDVADITKSQARAGEQFKISNLGELEKNIIEADTRFERHKKQQTVATIGAAAAAGAVAGATTSAIADTLDAVNEVRYPSVDDAGTYGEASQPDAPRPGEATPDTNMEVSWPSAIPSQIPPEMVEGELPEDEVSGVYENRTGIQEQRSETAERAGESQEAEDKSIGTENKTPTPVMEDDHTKAGGAINSWGGVIDEDQLAQTESSAESAADAESEQHSPHSGEALVEDSSAVAETAVSTTDIYEVQKGDNLWNILEGEVEGREMSEVLERIPADHRDDALEELFDRVDESKELRDEIGMHGKTADEVFYDVDGKGNGEKLKIVVLERELENIATEKGYFSDASEPQVNEHTFSEEVGQSKDEPQATAPESPEAEAIPAGNEHNPELDEHSMPEPHKDIHSRQPAFVLTDSNGEQTVFSDIDSYVEEKLGRSEKGFLGILPDSPNSFDALKGERMSEIRNMADGTYADRDISVDQWDKLRDMIEEMRKVTPIRGDETLEEFASRVEREAFVRHAANDQNYDQKLAA